MSRRRRSTNFEGEGSSVSTSERRKEKKDVTPSHRKEVVQPNFGDRSSRVGKESRAQSRTGGKKKKEVYLYRGFLGGQGKRRTSRINRERMRFLSKKEVREVQNSEAW